jgi:hypothetical protein
MILATEREHAREGGGHRENARPLMPQHWQRVRPPILRLSLNVIECLLINY